MPKFTILQTQETNQQLYFLMIMSNFNFIMNRRHSEHFLENNTLTAI